MSINKPVYINPTQGLSLPTYVTGQYLTNNGTTLSWAANGMGDLLANGTVPLAAAWATKYPLLFPDGSASNPAVSFENYPGAGMYIDSGYLKVDGADGQIFQGNGGLGSAFNIKGQYLQFNDNAIIVDGANGLFNITQLDITAGAGTGLTVNSSGHLNRQVYKVTVDYTGFSAAATHAHHVIATLPAKTRIVGIIADTTVAYSGGAVSACTLEVGKTTDTGIEYILLHDVKTAAVVKGLVDGDLGESLIHDHAVQGGDLPSWTTTTDITATIRTTDANTSALGAGSTTFYITTERF
jgi:hypothetical protein